MVKSARTRKTSRSCAAGAAINKGRRDEATPLFAAAQDGHLAIVKILCDAGADKHKPRFDGDTPEKIAAVENHTDVAHFLAEFIVSSKKSGGVAGGGGGVGGGAFKCFRGGLFGGKPKRSDSDTPRFADPAHPARAGAHAQGE